MELSLPHTLHLFNIFHENDGKENCAQVLDEEVYKMFSTKSLNDEHDCNVVSVNTLNIHDANDMQRYKLWDAMFDEDDIFCPPSFDEQIYYDEIMPPIYDDYIYESGFGEVMTLFSDESTILEEVPIDYENKVAIYDYYCADMYAIKNNGNHETCHHDFNFHSHDSYFVEFAPTTIDEKKFAYGRVISFLCFCVMKRMLYVMVILLNFFMMLLKIIMREELMLVGNAIISCFLSLC